MNFIDRLRSKGIAYCMLLLVAILFAVFIAYHPANTYADDGEIIIDPESISVDDDKAGNVLAEYGFAVFTEESMQSMQEIKTNKEKEQKQMLSDLFESKWGGSTDYDKEVREVIEAGALFEDVDTGVEVAEDTGINSRNTQKWATIIIVLILMCLMSAVAVGWNRKRYENNHNNRTS